MKELNEMTIGRTDGPENPFRVPAFEAARLFGAGSRIPSGPAVMMPRQQAEHMIAIDPPVRIPTSPLASKGPSTHDWIDCPDVERAPGKVSGQPIVKGTQILANGVVVNAESGISPEELANEHFPSSLSE